LGTKTTHEETFQEDLTEDMVFLRLSIVFISNVAPAAARNEAFFEIFRSAIVESRVISPRRLPHPLPGERLSNRSGADAANENICQTRRGVFQSSY
jgi:hypothetical protein